MVNNLAEAVGYALIVAFLYAVWPPLALLGAGVLLVVWANARAARSEGRSGRTMAAVTAAVTAARSAYRQQDTTRELRSVA